MSKSHPRWRLAKKILTWLFFIAVIVLLVVYAKKVDWEEVWKVIRDYNRVALLSAVGLVVVVEEIAPETCAPGVRGRG
jgi:glycosyltransferase 2 family protein